MKLLLLTLLFGAPMWAGQLEDSLMEADRAFDRATAARGLEGWMNCFAEDAQANTHGGVLKGKAALREYYSGMFSRRAFSIRWKPLFAEASRDGGLGYTFGEAETSLRDEKGEVQKRPGRNVTVWRRQPDGSWKVATDIGN